MSISREVITRGPEETRAFAEKFARENIGPGAVIALKGELGAGKTCFAQGAAWGLGVDRKTYLSSPTFTLVKEYAGRLRVVHVDLYRLKSAAEALDIGIEEYFSEDGAVFVEWPEIIGQLLEDIDVITVDIDALSENERRIRIHSGD